MDDPSKALEEEVLCLVISSGAHPGTWREQFKVFILNIWVRTYNYVSGESSNEELIYSFGFQF